MVAFGVGKVNGAYVGGHVNNLVTISKSLAERGYEVHIVTTPPIHGESEFKQPQIHEKIKIHTVGLQETTSKEVSETGRRSVTYGLKAARKLIPKIIKLNSEYDFDVVHGHSGFPGVAIVPTAVKIITRTPAVHTLYCPIDDYLSTKMVSLCCLRHLDAVIGISSNVSMSLEKNNMNSRVVNIPPLVDTSQFDGNSKLSQNRKFKILFVGNFSTSKGIDVLLRALDSLSEQGDSVELLFAFDMPVDRYESEDLPIKNQITDLGLSDMVVPLGIVDDLPQKMREADVFVAPFRDTQGPADYPLTILEAMASGLPVVATKVGGIPEIIDDSENGLSIEPGDPEELVRSLLKINNDPEFSKHIAKNAQQTVDEMNSDVIDSLIQLYERVCD